MDEYEPQKDTIADVESGDWALLVTVYTSDDPEKGYVDVYLYKLPNRVLVNRRVGPGSESGNLIGAMLADVPDEATRDDLKKRFGRAFADYLVGGKK
jgi:hypothetical protein